MALYWGGLTGFVPDRNDKAHSSQSVTNLALLEDRLVACPKFIGLKGLI